MALEIAVFLRGVSDVFVGSKNDCLQAKQKSSGIHLKKIVWFTIKKHEKRVIPIFCVFPSLLNPKTFERGYQTNSYPGYQSLEYATTTRVMFWYASETQ